MESARFIGRPKGRPVPEDMPPLAGPSTLRDLAI